MNLRHLRYFVTVAEERHFTRAAERLGIGQPPLSMQIKKLEDEIGAPLLRRLTRGVELTDVGALVFEHAQQILAQVDRMMVDARRLSRGVMGHMTVGFAGATYLQPLVPSIIREYRLQHSGVQLSPEQSNTPSLLRGLLDGHIDVAFIRPPIDDVEGVDTKLLVEEEMVLVVPQDHELASMTDPVPLASVASETFILFPRIIGTGLYDIILSACERVGFMPSIGQEAPQIASIIPMVAAGFGVSIVPRSLMQIRVDNVVYLPIEGDVPRTPISLAWRRHDPSPIVRSFLNVVNRLTQRDPA
jgi:DNA-binding transcriptional LysR family regulator